MIFDIFLSVLFFFINNKCEQIWYHISFCLRLKFLFKIFKHDFSELSQVNLMLPSPIASSLCIIDRVWPTVSDVLPGIGFINDLQFWVFLFYLVCQFFYRKTDCRQIVSHSVLDLFRWRVHNVDRSLDRIVNVHHWQPSLFFYETCVLSFQDTVVKYGDCIICCTSSRLCLPTDNSWISDTSDIQGVLFEVVSTQHLACVLCHSVHGCWLDRTVLRSALLWSCGTKYCH